MEKLKLVDNILRTVSALISAALSVIKFIGILGKSRKPKAACT